MKKIAGRMLPTIQQITTIMPNATKLYQGVMIQNAFKSYIVSIMPQSGRHHSYPIKELSNYRIQDAKYEKGILMVVASKIDSGQYDRLIFKFNKDWSNYKLFRIIENVAPSGINFTVIKNTTCICITEEEKVEIFSNQLEQSTIKSIEDDAITLDMHLYTKDDCVIFAKDNKTYSMTMN
jgi:hypothetical protein